MAAGTFDRRSLFATSPNLFRQASAEADARSEMSHIGIALLLIERHRHHPGH